MLTPAQIEDRRQWIGASDMPPLLIADQYATPRDVWAKKVYGIEPEPETGKVEAKHVGSFLESGVLQMAERETGWTVQRDSLVRHVEGTKLRPMLDGWINGETGVEPVEAKTAGLLNPMGVNPDEWGASGTDHVPEKYIVQVHVQLMATGAEVGHLAALLSGVGFRLYTIRRNDDLVKLITRKADQFWECVESKREPQGEPPTMETLKAIRREPDSVVRMRGPEAIGMIEAWQLAARQAREAEAQAEEAKRTVIASLGDSESAWIQWHAEDLPRLAAALEIPEDKAAEKGKLTYLEQARPGIDVSALKRDLPDVYAKYEKVSRFRVLRLSKSNDPFVEKAADAEVVDLNQLQLIGGTDDN